jgi:hypothetical protein
VCTAAQGRPNELEADPQPGDDDGHQAEVRPVAVSGGAVIRLPITYDVS